MAGAEQLAAVDYLRWLWRRTGDQEVEGSSACAGANYPPLPGLRVVDTLCVKWKRRRNEVPHALLPLALLGETDLVSVQNVFLGKLNKFQFKMGQKYSTKKNWPNFESKWGKRYSMKKKHPGSCSVCYRYPCCNSMDSTTKLRSTTVMCMCICVWHLFVQNSGVPLKLYYPCLPLWDFSNQACTLALTP